MTLGSSFAQTDQEGVIYVRARDKKLKKSTESTAMGCSVLKYSYMPCSRFLKIGAFCSRFWGICCLELLYLRLTRYSMAARVLRLWMSGSWRSSRANLLRVGTFMAPPARCFTSARMAEAESQMLSGEVASSVTSK